MQVDARYPSARHLQRHRFREHHRVRNRERVVQPFTILTRRESLDVGRLVRLRGSALVEHRVVDMTRVDDQVVSFPMSE